MSTKEILDLVCSLLPEDIKNNEVFKRTAFEFKCILDEINITNINVRADIAELDERLRSENGVAVGESSSPVLFSMLSRDCEFFVEVSNIPMITYNVLKSLDDDYQEGTNIEIVIKDCSTTLKYTKYHTNRAGYYFDYDVDMFCYNKDGDPVEIENKEHFLDDIFAGDFGISIEDARECRLNFAEYAEDLNKIKAEVYLDGVDEIDDSIFLPPFKMSDLGLLLTGIADEAEDDTYDESDDEDNTEDYEDDEEDDGLDEYIDEDALNTVEKIKEELVRIMGEDGMFTMNRSIFYNINDYVSGRVILLATKGKFIRKLNGEYTVFYVSIRDDSVICIPKQVGPEEVKQFYEADSQNPYVEGLDDFFGISKKIDFKPKKEK